MKFVKGFDINKCGVEYKQVPCITGEGAPTTATKGAVGCLYMDTLTGDTYKCIAVTDGVYTWKENLNSRSVRFILTNILRVSENVLNDDMVTLGAGWSGNLTDGFTHTAGSTEPLTFAINAADGEAYFIAGDCTNTGATIVHLSIGDSFPTDPYDGTDKISWGVTCVNGGSLVITPQSSF